MSGPKRNTTLDKSGFREADGRGQAAHLTRQSPRLNTGGCLSSLGYVDKRRQLQCNSALALK